MEQARSTLRSLSVDEPLHGIEKARWRELLTDARWLHDNFAARALRDGWIIGELFGLWWWTDDSGLHRKDGWGGIADRLQGSRSLKMTADRAIWRRMWTGEPDQLARTAYPGLRPLWEVPDA